MIYATYQLLNEGVPTGKPVTKNFKSTEEMGKWEISQSHHPFLTYARIGFIELGKNPSIVSIV